MNSLTEKIRFIGGRIFAVLKTSRKLTVRDLAKQANTSKSSAHRQALGIKKRNIHPESSFWEQEEGYEWIRLVYFGTLLIFGVEQGVGADNLSRFFKMLRLDTHIGTSPSSIRASLTALQDMIIRFQEEVEKCQGGAIKNVIGAADETFFGNLLILVFMDLSSGYIILEDIADGRSFDTWLKMAEPRLEQLGVKVQLLVSDRAKALIKLVVDGFNCEHHADIFHSQNDISKWMGSALGRCKSKTKRNLNKCVASQEKAEKREASKTIVETKVKQVEQAKAEDRVATQDLDDYRKTLRKISLTIHPFKLKDNNAQDSANAKKALREQTKNIKTLARKRGIYDKNGVMNKFKNQISELVPSIVFWWLLVLTNLLSQGFRSKELLDWSMFYLLPTVYWHKQMKKTKNTTIRKEYEKAWGKALVVYHTHALTGTFSEDEILFWQNWAQEMVVKFHRASSAVEGRNGFLTQIYNNHRGLSPNRLKAPAVLHNFFITRPDGSTAVERLFGEKPPDLLEWLLHRMGELPLPRKSRKRVKSNPLNLLSVPA
ncbi:MAG: DUF6399 domain-containing protein [Gammaproteobacteria bacterium]|nr:DUF6399 domain-containing protein [Gammaproteobacteria bacterium]